MKIKYKDWNPRKPSLALLDKCTDILNQYAEDGYDLTLRQLYYQLVAADLIPNKQSEYDKLGRMIDNARNAGMVDWGMIKDRGRALYGLNSWDTPEEFLAEQAGKFHLDPWRYEKIRLQVWVEKDALSSVIKRACTPFRVDYFPCKGYMSASAVWSMGRLTVESGIEKWVILHLGDHDPSGLDMSRDIQARLSLYSSPIEGHDEYDRPEVEVKRIALNMNQIEEHTPPPNPLKMTDTKSVKYRAVHGESSWELDALKPATIVDLIQGHIEEHIEGPEKFNSILYQEKQYQKKLREGLPGSDCR